MIEGTMSASFSNSITSKVTDCFQVKDPASAAQRCNKLVVGQTRFSPKKVRRFPTYDSVRVRTDGVPRNKILIFAV